MQSHPDVSALLCPGGQQPRLLRPRAMRAWHPTPRAGGRGPVFVLSSLCKHVFIRLTLNSQYWLYSLAKMSSSCLNLRAGLRLLFCNSLCIALTENLFMSVCPPATKPRGNAAVSLHAQTTPHFITPDSWITGQKSEQILFFYDSIDIQLSVRIFIFRWITINGWLNPTPCHRKCAPFCYPSFHWDNRGVGYLSIWGWLGLSIAVDITRLYLASISLLLERHLLKQFIDRLWTTFLRSCLNCTYFIYLF